MRSIPVASRPGTSIFLTRLDFPNHEIIVAVEREAIDIRPPKAEARRPRDKPDPEKLLTMTERAIAAAAQLVQAEKVPPELRQQFETLLSRSLPSVKRKQAALPAPPEGEPP